MKQYIKYLTAVLILAFVIFEVIIFAIICYPKDVFDSAYQNVIVDKYRILQNTESPKIIVVSGSSSAFGLDQELLEKESGYNVVNLGLHASFGHLFNSELAKENINRGDIVLLGYEYIWQDEDGFESLGQDLIMTGIDDNIDIYKHIPVDHWKDFVGFIFKYAEKKYSFGGSSGIYSREAFDQQTAQMTMDRQYVMGVPYKKEAFGIIDITGVQISENSINYLSEYKKYVESRGANVYFISPPILKRAIACDYQEFENLKEQEIELIGIPYISNPEDYFFEDEYMSNSIYHCSTKGEKKRTELLIKDLRRADIIQ